MLAPKTLSAAIDLSSETRHQNASSSLQRARLLLPIKSTAKAQCRRRRRHCHVAASTPSPLSSPCPISSPWICPSCSSPLSFSSRDLRSLVCLQRHCYDVSREGYVNLSRSGRKARKVDSGPSGDAPESLAARARFFDAGHFDVVMEAAAEAVVEVLGRQNGRQGMRTVLDAGCGEGSYLRRLARRCSSPSPPSSSLSTSIQLLGVDISKAAVRSAASRAQREFSSSSLRSSFAVASAFDLPLPDASVSCALVAFAPIPSAELRRVLIGADGGGGSAEGTAGADSASTSASAASDASAAVVVVGPGPDHFFGLKRAVYGEDRARRKRSEGGDDDEDELAVASSSSPADIGAAASATRRRRRRRIRYDLELDGASALDLLTMTPYYWRASEETRARLAREGLETEVDVLVDVVERDELDLL